MNTSNLHLKDLFVSAESLSTNTPLTTVLPVFDLASYLPDSIVPQYEEFKETLVSWLQGLGIIKAEVPSSTGLLNALNGIEY